MDGSGGLFLMGGRALFSADAATAAGHVCFPSKGRAGTVMGSGHCPPSPTVPSLSISLFIRRTAERPTSINVRETPNLTEGLLENA